MWRPIMDRAETAVVVARRVARRVKAVAPAGLGTWGPAWEIVEDPSTEFLDALHRWETAVDPSETAEEALKDAVRSAGDKVVEAWREAARRWEAAGRPDVSWTPSQPMEAAR
jgi:hypothetical protein